jgi:rhodanese-related sulfurtransferase
MICFAPALNLSSSLYFRTTRPISIVPDTAVAMALTSVNVISNALTASGKNPTRRTNPMSLSKSWGIGVIALLSSLAFQTGGSMSAQPSGEVASASFRTISTDDLAEMLDRKDFSLINVHIPYEGEIERTDAFIPFDKIADEISDHVDDQEALIVLYCMSGRMSEIAGEALAKAGYTNVSHVAGGMIDWKAKDREILHRWR